MLYEHVSEDFIKSGKILPEIFHAENQLKDNAEIK